MSERPPETPIRNAIAYIEIASVAVGGLCYLACVQNVPIVSYWLYWVATLVYARIPVLARLHGVQTPYLVSSATVAFAFFILMLPFAGRISRLCGPNTNQMEAQIKVMGRKRRRRGVKVQ